MTVQKSQPHNFINIYQMYEQNNCKLNFFVRRNSWDTIFAKIVDIEGVKEGENIQGKPPYFGNPIVTALFFNARTKKCTSLGELRCPGTYAYTMIDEPKDIVI